MRKAIGVIGAVLIVCVLVGCASTENRGGQAFSRIEVRAWEGKQYGAKYEALDEDLQRFAPKAHAALLDQFRVRYAWSDRAEEVKPLVSNCIVVGTLSDMERVAQDAKEEIRYVKLTTLGQCTEQKRKGVVIEFRYENIDGEFEAWEALSPAEKQARPAPEHFDMGGSSFNAYVVGKGRKLIIYQGGTMTWDPAPPPPPQ